MKMAKTILLISAILLTLVLIQNIKVMQDTEIWKAVPGYEGYYEASDQGRVRSLSIRVHFQPFKIRATPLLLKFNPIKRGYLIVRLYKNGVGKDNLVSRLVLFTFNGPGPEGCECDHINSITSDNRLSNLRWVSPRQNVHHAIAKKKHLTSSKYIGVIKEKRYGGWAAKIKINKKSISLGVFRNEIDAHLAYQKALNKINEDEKHINNTSITA